MWFENDTKRTVPLWRKWTDGPPLTQATQWPAPSGPFGPKRTVPDGPKSSPMLYIGLFFIQKMDRKKVDRWSTINAGHTVACALRSGSKMTLKEPSPYGHFRVGRRLRSFSMTASRAPSWLRRPDLMPYSVSKQMLTAFLIWPLDQPAAWRTY